MKAVIGFLVPLQALLGAAPDLPTMAESGYPNFEAVPWFGLMAPAEFAALIKAEIPQWAKVIKDAGIKATD